MTAAAALLSGASLAVATSFYVSPTGTTSTAQGTGTITNPWALQTALSQPAVVHPGDTIWLRGGTYTGHFTSYLTGTASQPIVVRPYPGERATLDGNMNPSESGNSEPVLTVHICSGYTWYWGLEVTNSSPIRYNPRLVESTVCRGDGIFVSGAGDEDHQLCHPRHGAGDHLLVIGEWTRNCTGTSSTTTGGTHRIAGTGTASTLRTTRAARS